MGSLRQELEMGLDSLWDEIGFAGGLSDAPDWNDDLTLETHPFVNPTSNDHLGRLRRLTMELGKAITSEEVADAIIAGAMGSFGATSGSIAILQGDGMSMSTIRCFGYPAGVVERYRNYPIETSLPNADVARSGSPLFVERVAERDRMYPHLAQPTSRQRGALAALPLIMDGHTIGGLALSFPFDRPFSDEDKDFLQTITDLCAQALQRALLYDKAQYELAERRRLDRALETANAELTRALEREHAIAATLQQSLLLIPGPGEFPGLDVRTRYCPAVKDLQVGGDFLDVFALPNGNVALVVGDVSGKGLNAAARTAEVKYVLRGYLREDCDPDVALDRLNHYLCQSQRLDRKAAESGFICLALAVVDPASGATMFCLAGADPPVIVRTDGEVEIAGNHGLPLIVSETPGYESSHTVLNPGDILAIVTDGITEARIGTDFFGTEGLVDVMLKNRTARALGQTAETILTSARAHAGGILRDDACVLLARR